MPWDSSDIVYKLFLIVYHRTVEKVFLFTVPWHSLWQEFADVFHFLTFSISHLTNQIFWHRFLSFPSNIVLPLLNDTHISKIEPMWMIKIMEWVFFASKNVRFIEECVIVWKKGQNYFDIGFLAWILFQMDIWFQK